MTENEITRDILDSSIKIHRQFGPGMLESVYEVLLAEELKKMGYLRIVRDYAFAASIRKYLRFSAPPREIKTSNLSHAELRRGGGLYYDGKRDNKGYP